tara:strand:+ start:1881 stop:2594 length:714 start_codon:yes stop_codon:yes gene_type:complete
MDDFWNKQLTPGYYDKVLEDGLLKKRGIQSNWHHSTFVNVSNLIINVNNHLDYACCPGTFIGKYLDLNSIGVDISEKQIDYASRKYESKGQFLTTEDFKYKQYEKNFEAITIIGLFEYLSDNEILNLMKQMHFILSNDGKVIITTPNYKSFMSILDRIVNRFSKVNYEAKNINKFDSKKILELMKKTSFRNVEVKKIINVGVFVGFINIRLSQIIQSFIYKLTNGRYGYLLMVIITK